MKTRIGYQETNFMNRISIILSAAAIFSIALLLGTIALLFLLGATAHLLSIVLPMFLAYVIVSAICVAIALCIYAFRRILILDPLARFVSRLIVEQPTKRNDEITK